MGAVGGPIDQLAQGRAGEVYWLCENVHERMWHCLDIEHSLARPQFHERDGKGRDAGVRVTGLAGGPDGGLVAGGA